MLPETAAIDLNRLSFPSFFIHKSPETARKREEIFNMEQNTIAQERLAAKEQRALEKIKRANAELAKIRREQREQLRAEQSRHKYMMGGCVVKYFPDDYDAYDFNEQEMNRIIACAFKNRDVQNMIKTVVKERPADEQETNTSEVEIDTAETEENDIEEGEENEGGEA